jgi:transcriptional regulator with XRE-family HTH domain
MLGILLYLATRVLTARQSAGLSQERLGVAAGIEEASASHRMNQYERGKHEPDFGSMPFSVELDARSGICDR